MKRTTTIVVCALFAVFIAGCGGQSYTYESDTEQKPGPGIFSGEDGVFTLIEKGGKGKNTSDE